MNADDMLDPFTKAKAHYREGDYDGCYVTCKQILAENSGLPSRMVSHLLGDVCLELKKFDEAVDVYSHLLSANEDDVAYANRAFAYFEKGNVSAAARDYMRAVDCNPQNAVAARLGAESLLKLDRFDEAIELLNRVIKQQPRSADLFKTLGLVYSGKGEWMSAYKAFHRAGEIDPADKVSQKALTDIERMTDRS